MLALSDKELSVVRAILRAHLAPDTLVSVFGSRATAKAKPWSDLDLDIEAPEPLPLSLLAALAEAFSESDLPWKVDLVDWQTVDCKFAEGIAQSLVPLPLMD